MHIAVDLSGMLVVIVLGGLLLFSLLPPPGNWSRRRKIQVLILALPLVCLIVLIGGFIHVASGCSGGRAFAQDHLIDLLPLSLLGLTLLGALLLGGVRLLVASRFLERTSYERDGAFQTRADAWAAFHGMPPLRIWVTRSPRPLALLVGIRKPTVILSTWMLEQMDEEELETVLVHEFTHALRHDTLLRWIALLLRDAFFYLPTSQKAFHQFRQEQDFACDDKVVQATGNPLALASALTKVWLYHADQPHSALAQSLVGSDLTIKQRIERLLAHQSESFSKTPSLLSSIGIFLGVIGFGILCLVAEVGCWPILWH